MCCGNRVVTNQQARAAAVTTWKVLDGDGKAVDTKTSEIAAKLAAARIGGTVEKQSTS